MQVDKEETFTIPDKCRKVGKPGGKYILYIEDYAHTFIRQNLQIYKQKMTFFSYGKAFETDGTYYILIQGAIDKKIEQTEYFSEESYLGTMTVNTRKKEKVDSKWIIQCDFSKEIQCTLEDYNIYYEKNELMQNYLINWHEQLERKGENQSNDVKMKYARAIQDQHRNIKEINGQSKIYTGICLAFCMIFMVMLVTVLNSYQKMNKLQTDLVKFLEHIEDNNELTAIETMKEISPDIEPEIIKAENLSTNDEETTDEDITDEGTTEQSHTEEQDIEQEEMENNEENSQEEPEEREEALQQEVAQKTEAQITAEAQIEQDNSEHITNNQTYIVQKGDTLQGILYRKYGTLSDMENICTLNSLSNPDDIKEGEELYLP